MLYWATDAPFASQAVVGHPHVVALHAVYEDVHSLHMIMDWCGGGSLWQLMERCPGYMLPEPAAAAATKAVLEVLAHCHARCVFVCERGCKTERWFRGCGSCYGTCFQPELF